MKTMNGKSALAVAAIALLVLSTAPQAREVGAGARGWRGPQGAGGVTARRYRNDGEGNASGGHLHAYERPNGNTGYRAGQFDKNADGSASRTSEAQRTTQQGTLERSSTGTRDADGNTNYQRDTTLTGTAGNTIESQVTRENGTVTRAVTCNGGECPKPGDAP
jgi:hypothetical protein